MRLKWISIKMFNDSNQIQACALDTCYGQMCAQVQFNINKPCLLLYKFEIIMNVLDKNGFQ